MKLNSTACKKVCKNQGLSELGGSARLAAREPSPEPSLESSLEPSLGVVLPPCAQIAAGGHHSLFVTQRGAVLSCGKGGTGALGLGDRLVRTTPTAIGALASARVVAVAAGQAHSAFVTEGGVLYACGLVSHGRLGFDVPSETRTHPMLACMTPTVVTLPAAARHVVAGLDHTLVTTRDGRVFAFGRGQAGQLGSGARKDVWRPTEVALAPPAATSPEVWPAPPPAADGSPDEQSAAAHLPPLDRHARPLRVRALRQRGERARAYPLGLPPSACSRPLPQ